LQGDALARHFNSVSNDITLLQGERADQDTIHQSLNDIARRTLAEDTLVLIFVGHGSYDGERFRFNVKGPDFTARELASWLDPVRAEHQLVVFTGSSSGAVLGPLERAGRTIFSATRSGEERNATVFGQFFVAAFEDNVADTDKDQRITAFEAFQYAASRVEQYYESQNMMQTEHPTSSRSGPAKIILARLQNKPTPAPASSPLLARATELELAIYALKLDKASYSQDAYFDQLQRLLLDLAFVEMELKRTAEGDTQ